MARSAGPAPLSARSSPARTLCIRASALIADEHLTGAPRDAVQARVDQWLKSHIERLLAPLFELSGAADVTGIARGVAFQLVEALGVLDRPKVAEEVKGLQQPERASLRKYGVRFGAYNVYIPALLKPAPRALAVQLWELSHGGDDSKNLVDLLHLAGSGRTSIPVNKEIDANLYRTAGYRVCGERAVRVDILERLADLVRPALSWREGAPGQKPAAAFPGGGFTIVNGMTSLIGASGEDFASVLRSLGYRMERRPKPPEPAPAPAPAEAATPTAEQTPEHVVAESAEPGDAEIETTPGDAEAPATDQGLEPVAADEALASVDSMETEPVAPAPSIEAQAPDGDSHTSDAEAVSEPNAAFADAITAPDASTAPQADGTEATAPATTEAAPSAEEPAMVEVWRPGRAEGRHRPREHRRDDAGPGGRTRRVRLPAPMRRPSLHPAKPRLPPNNPRPRRRAGPAAPTVIATEAASAKGDAAIVQTGRRGSASVRSSGRRDSSGASAKRPQTRIRRLPNSRPSRRSSRRRPRSAAECRRTNPIVNGSTAGSGTPDWYAPAPPRPLWPVPAISASMACVSTHPAAWYTTAT